MLKICMRSDGQPLKDIHGFNFLCYDVDYEVEAWTRSIEERYNNEVKLTWEEVA